MTETANKTHCVFGLGSMGFGIAASLVKAGCRTAGFDLDKKREADLQALGGIDIPRDQVLAEADSVIIVVVNAAQTEALLFADGGIAAQLKPGCVVISCATVPPEFARDCEARLQALGLLYLDAPISGGSVKAAQGALTMMTSGTDAAYAASEPALDAMAEKIFKLGDQAGPGSAMKIVNQMLAGVHIAAAAEAITFGISQGIDPASTVEVISDCAGTSWMFENRGPHIVDGDYTPHSAVEIFVKDLGIVGDVARAARFSAPLTAAALQQFLAAAGMGHGREDDSAVAKVYAHNAGLKLPGDK